MSEDIPAGNDELIGLTADIVSAYVGNNSLPVADLPGLISQIHEALRKTATGAPAAEAQAQPLTPAVSIKKSVTPDYIICLEDGRKFKSLKRHLRTAYNLTPEQYRERWNLPKDYPMVAPNYAAARSSLAKSMGLGQKRTPAAPKAAEPAAAAPAPAAEKKRAGRPRKAAA